MKKKFHRKIVLGEIRLEKHLNEDDIFIEERLFYRKDFPIKKFFS